MVTEAPASSLPASQRTPQRHGSGARLPYPIAMSDVDGTLLGPDHTMSERTRDVICRYQEAGGVFALATGRMPSGTESLARMLGPSCWRICLSGALVISPTGEVIHSQTLDAESAQATLDTLEHVSPKVVPSYFCGLSWFTSDPDAEAIRREAQIVGARPLKADLRGLIAEGLLPNKIFCSQSFDEVESLGIQRALQERLPQLGVIRSTGGTMIEVIPPGVDKARGARRLIQTLGHGFEEVIAFGDDENDIPLLTAAGLGVAVANAPLRVRRAADDTAPSNAEDGVARYLERFL